jgi:hypothetical protein
VGYFAQAARSRNPLDALEPTLAIPLLSAQEARTGCAKSSRGSSSGRLRTEDRRAIRRLLVKSPPGLGKTREAIEWAIAYQSEQAGKDGTRLPVGDFNEAGVHCSDRDLRPAS